jgi:hypothetical protein
MIVTVKHLSQLPTATIDLNIASEEFRNDSIMVTLESVENSVVSVEPQAQVLNISNLDPRRILLTLSYNTVYNLSATACGQSASYIIELHYGKSISNLSYSDVLCYSLFINFTAECDSPIRLLSEESKRRVIADYSHPALEGTNVSLSCPPGLVLTGPNASVCMENGEWEPDPSQVQCNGKE